MKTKYLFAAVLTALMATSCSDDTMDRINTDTAHPAANVVDAKFQITDAITSTVYSTLCGAYAWYVSSYTEQIFGTGNNQLKNAELRMASETAASTTFNNEWNATYLNLNNLNTIKKKCAEGGVNEGQYDLLGMAQTLEALNWGTLTDLHGDIPRSECFTGVSAPAIDTQESIYNYIFELLDSAVINFKRANDDHVGSQDILFAADIKQWEGLAHALKARYLLHTQGRNSSVMSQVLTEANAAVEAGFDGAVFDVFNGVTADNPWSAYWWSRYYSASTSTVVNLMTERNDPREAIYNCLSGYSDGTVANPGNSELAALSAGYYMNYPAWLDNGAAYLHLFSKAELYFILAEAEVRLEQQATSEDSIHFAMAIKAAFDDYAATGGSLLGLSFTDNEVNEYILSVMGRYKANPISEIITQKYIAQTRDEQLETYNDIRRLRYVDGSYPVEMTNANNTQSGTNRWPLRLPYGESDVTSNPNVASAFGSGNDAGSYVFTESVWWAGGSR